MQVWIPQVDFLFPEDNRDGGKTERQTDKYRKLIYILSNTLF